MLKKKNFKNITYISSLLITTSLIYYFIGPKVGAPIPRKKLKI